MQRDRTRAVPEGWLCAALMRAGGAQAEGREAAWRGAARTVGEFMTKS